MTKTSFAVAAVVALAALTGGISCANAGGNHMQMHMLNNMHNGMHNNFFRHRPRLGIIIASTGVGCGSLYDRWIYSGDYFWKRKYDFCRSGW
jgi:hypothetical protein